jgi:hypothetical protein
LLKARSWRNEVMKTPPLGGRMRHCSMRVGCTGWPRGAALEEFMWDRVRRLHEHHGEVAVEVRILKLTEEVGD